MSKNSNKLIIPVYINEKIVLDMLAIIEDGFSIISQIDYNEVKNNVSSLGIDAGVSTSASLLSRLLRIDVSANANRENNETRNQNVKTERTHTNVSLLSKLRDYLEKQDLVTREFDIKRIQIGDFVEFEGRLQKNPLVDYLDSVVGMFDMVEIFTDTPQLGSKKQTANQKKQESIMEKQVKEFLAQIKDSGTVDFLIQNEKNSIVLSAQEKYLENDNVSEIIGGRFKVLGKVIRICSDPKDNVDLLRKTSLASLSDELLKELFSAFESEQLKDFKLPQLITTIEAPVLIVIPIAIYA